MKRTVLLAAAIAALLITACSPQEPGTGETARQTAEDWIRNAPTYAYDGQNLQLESQRSAGDTHQFIYNFTSNHGGYGNRSDEFVTQAVTPHVIEVQVDNGEVTEAVIDDRWSELRQELINAGNDETPQDLARTWIRNAPTYSYDGQDLQLQSRNESGDTHVFTYNFTSTHGGYGNRSGEVVTQVLTPHTVTVHLYEDEVVKAVIDDQWDELDQRPIDDGEAEVFELTYQPMQCETTPWREWYEAGGAQFIQEPDDSKLITAYYGSQGVNLSGVDRQERNGPVCDACEICPTGTFYTADVADGVQTLKDDGWTVTANR